MNKIKFILIYMLCMISHCVYSQCQSTDTYNRNNLGLYEACASYQIFQKFDEEFGNDINTEYEKYSIIDIYIIKPNKYEFALDIYKIYYKKYMIDELELTNKKLEENDTDDITYTVYIIYK